MAVQFQSEEYFEAVNEALAGNEDVAKAAKGHTIKLQVVTTDFPELGGKRSFIHIEKGSISVGSGDIEEPDITITQDYDTAVELDKGELNPQAAFLDGRIKLKGNIMKVMSLQKLLQTLGPATEHIERQY